MIRMFGYGGIMFLFVFDSINNSARFHEHLHDYEHNHVNNHVHNHVHVLYLFAILSNLMTSLHPTHHSPAR